MYNTTSPNVVIFVHLVERSSVTTWKKPCSMPPICHSQTVEDYSRPQLPHQRMTCVLQNDSYPPATNAMVVVDFGDGSSNETVPLTVNTTTDQVFTHVVLNTDILSASIYIYNNVSNGIFLHDIIPGRRIE